MSNDLDYDSSFDEEDGDEQLDEIIKTSGDGNKQPTRQKIEQFWEMYRLNKQINGDIYSDSFGDE